MGEIVNLNKVRKQRDRDDKARTASINRAKHGRTKDERAREDAAALRRDKDLDSKQLD